MNRFWKSIIGGKGMLIQGNEENESQIITNELLDVEIV